MTSSDALGGRGFTEQRLGASRTQEHSQDCAAADPQRLWLGASLPQKKFTRLCSSSISGIMESYNTHLAPGFTLTTLFQYQQMWLFSGVCLGGCTVSTKCPSSRGAASPHVAQRPLDFTLLLGIRPCH